MAGRARSTRVPPWVPFFNPIARLLLTAGVPLGPNARKEEVTAVELGPTEAVEFFRDVLGPRVRRARLGSWIVRNVDKVDIDNPAEAARGRPVFELLAP